MTVVVFTTTGSQTWTVPAGVTSIQVEAIGGGAGSTGGISSGGGGGGAYAEAASVTVTPGATYYIHVGVANTTTTLGSANSLSWGNTTNVKPTSSTTGALADCGVKGGSQKLFPWY